MYATIFLTLTARDGQCASLGLMAEAYLSAKKALASGAACLLSSEILNYSHSGGYQASMLTEHLQQFHRRYDLPWAASQFLATGRLVSYLPLLHSGMRWRDFR